MQQVTSLLYCLFSEKIQDRRQRLVSQKSLKESEGPQGVDLQKLFRNALVSSKHVCILYITHCFDKIIKPYNFDEISYCSMTLQMTVSVKTLLQPNIIMFLYCY